MLVAFAFVYEGQQKYIFLFITILFISSAIRIFLKIYIEKNGENKLLELTRIYVFASLIIGLDFAFLSTIYYNLENIELRLFLTIVNIALITASVSVLAVWIHAYIAFSLPQLFALTAVFIFNDNIPAAAATVVFSWYIFMVAKNFNLKFKEGQKLIEENNALIADMEIEINTRKKAQYQLEQYQQKLQGMVKERTSELETINDDLHNQVDIRRIIEKELEFLAYYDELTGLPNRSLFIETLKKSISQAKRNESTLSVLFIDLDRFKKINDSYGHHVGDKLLIEVAKRLKLLLRDSDTVARNGGDEFVVLIDNMKDDLEPFVVATKIIEQMNNKFDINEHVVHIGASIGIAIYPVDGETPLDLLKMSDTAMYEAKKMGRNSFQFYSDSMSNQISDRLKLENALRLALDNNEFYLVYQPQLNIHTQKVVGYEALLRWQNTELGLVSPDKFIPVLEDTGLIYSVGEWIILEVLRFIKSGKNNDTKVSINLSALQCGITNYSTQIKKFIEQADIDPSLLEFEITETLLISDFNQAEMFLTQISKLGCTIALDDFGTGYTSFSYLTKLPIDIIKIDRSLVTGIDKNKNLQDIVKAIVTMSQSLEIKNIFEGVETTNELEMVKQLNGEIVQGYLLSKPLEVSQIDNWRIE